MDDDICQLFINARGRSTRVLLHERTFVPVTDPSNLVQLLIAPANSASMAMAMADLGFPVELSGQPPIPESAIARRTRDWAYPPVNFTSTFQILIGKVWNWDTSDQNLKRRGEIHGVICPVPSPPRNCGLGNVRMASQLHREAEIHHCRAIEALFVTEGATAPNLTWPRPYGELTRRG